MEKIIINGYMLNQKSNVFGSCGGLKKHHSQTIYKGPVKNIEKFYKILS